MSKAGFLLVSVPPSDANQSVESAYKNIEGLLTRSSDLAETSHFPIPEFKIGNLGALVQHAEELIKVDTQCEGYVLKIADVLRNILQGDQSKINEQQVVNDKSITSYLKSYTWNVGKYRTDRSIGDLIEILNKEGSSLENDVRTKFNQYNAVKGQLQQYQRRATGNLSTKHLGEVVRKEHVLSGSEYMETLFFAVPINHIKEWEGKYESLTQMVVPRSSTKISEDQDFALYNVVVFKKFAQEFVAKAREAKFTPRDFTYDKEEVQRAKKEYEEAGSTEKKLWGETLRLGRAAFGDAFQAWTHVKALRVFVESVLRYGLPPKFGCAVVRPKKKQEKQIKKVLDDAFAHLGGRQFVEKKNSKKDKVRGGQDGLEESVSAVEGSLGLEDEYSPYVVFAINWVE
ncbi:Vacuolar ATP synthase subunit c [Taphrina deformans PYCC 5710]|uniref:V-type proton ATPase subunit C n=1 Tax=Taphrina deformans (strain PYCC 5710 / ATCC 11124 / CBS 356.35 / IMI 108563 / JCM 9778 / NBRC 8474) TaxID=1097556 RepID=R4XB63_TAPDE|nr:Vacuolar ATP synthase subunit c [Taphrina deformans PYCC 5710]|eukprot:CCG81567.1 Vacuolar ATP synthase subunit c [Taphrina deformans PYCC 5710]